MKRLLTDIRGATALEFALCAPAFFMLAIGIMEVGLLGYMQLALQQGVEAAARCASIDKISCPNPSQIQTYASAKSYGLSPPVSSFTVSTPPCGMMVQASYTPSYLPGFPIPVRTLSAKSCFPT
jgi:Flp pilus assembly protein TadG